MASGCFKITTSARQELVDVTREVEQAIRDTGIPSGVLYLFNPHTTAGLTINEGADPDVCRDIIKALERIVPDDAAYRHAEGNSPAHVKTLLTGSSLTAFFDHGRVLLGTWQKIFFAEFDGPRSRTVYWKIIADNQ